jgi:hypothetical protein
MDADKTQQQEPHRRAAREAIAESAKAPFGRKDYLNAVRQLPMLLVRHGLGQTLAYFQTRGTGQGRSPYDLVTRQLDRWLLTVMGVSARTALTAISTRDSRFYREATQQAWLFVRALCEELKEGS